MFVKLKSIVLKLILLNALCLNPAISFAQKLVYKIEYKEDSIGYLIAKKKQAGSKTIYLLESKTTFNMIINVDHYSRYRSEYENEVLVEALAESFLNDKERSHTRVSFNNGEYLIKKENEMQRHLSPIYESIATLYFNQPKRDKIFSERHGSFCQINKIGERQVELIKPDNRKNIYYFDNKECSRAIINLPVATIYLVKIANL